jgi:hypothetical protein
VDKLVDFDRMIDSKILSAGMKRVSSFVGTQSASMFSRASRFSTVPARHGGLTAEQRAAARAAPLVSALGTCTELLEVNEGDAGRAVTR